MVWSLPWHFEKKNVDANPEQIKLQKFLQKNEIQNKIGGRKWHLAGQNSAGRSD